jgi:hypothetical protein
MLVLKHQELLQQIKFGHYQAADGTAGQLLTTDGSGVFILAQLQQQE